MRKIGPLCGPISAIVYNAILKLLADKAAEIHEGLAVWI